MTPEDEKMALTEGCPRCTEQPQQWCSEWRDGIGMVQVVGLIHGERLQAAQWRDSVASGTDPHSHIATDEQIAEAIKKTGLF